MDPTAAPPHRLVVLGHSHVASLVAGYESIHAPATLPGSPSIAPSFAFLDGGVAVTAWGEGPPGRHVDPSWKQSTGACLAGADCVAILWDGNQFAARATLLTGPPFAVADSVASGHDAAPPGVALIPRSVFASIIAAGLESDTDLARVLEACGEKVPSRVALLAPAPPLPEEALRERLAHEAHFMEVLSSTALTTADVDIVPDALRRRLWEILVDTYESFALGHGAAFLRPPPSAFDAAGMLAQQYWGTDVSHANAGYGLAYLEITGAWAETALASTPQVRA